MPANTPKGLPYPLPDEPVAEGAVAIRNLAEAVDPKLPATPGPRIWTSPLSTPPAGIADGDLWIATGVGVAGEEWMFRYVAGQGYSFLGGPPLHAWEDTAAAVSTGAVWTGPRIVAPRTGGYSVTLCTAMYSSQVGADLKMWCGAFNGGPELSPFYRQGTMAIANSGFDTMTLQVACSNVSAGTEIGFKFLASAAGTATYRRSLTVLPIKLAA